MRETAYSFCKDSKCLYETYTKAKEDELFQEVNNEINERYTKTEVNTLLNKKQATILSGTALPTTGNDGDIFLLYEE